MTFSWRESKQYKPCFEPRDPYSEGGGDEFNQVVAAKDKPGRINYFLTLLEINVPRIQKNGGTQPKNFDTGEKCPIMDCFAASTARKGDVRGRGFEALPKATEPTSYKLYDHCYIACPSLSKKNAKEKYGDTQYELHINVKNKYGEDSFSWPYWKFSPTLHGWKLERREWNDESKMAFHFIMYAPPLEEE